MPRDASLRYDSIRYDDHLAQFCMTVSEKLIFNSSWNKIMHKNPSISGIYDGSCTAIKQEEQN